MDLMKICNNIAKEVINILGRDYEVKEVEIKKNNGVVKNVVSVRKIDEHVAKMFYIPDLYDPEELGVKTVSEKIAENAKKETIPETVSISEFEEIKKENIVMRLVNRKKNKDLLLLIPYREYIIIKAQN